MKKTVSIISAFALMGILTACEGMSFSNASMTKDQHEAFETAVHNGATLPKSVLAERAAAKGRADLYK